MTPEIQNSPVNINSKQLSLRKSIVFFCTVLLFTGIFSQAQDAPLDLLITGGRIIDGSGNPWFVGDVGVRDGKIVAVGSLAGRSAKRTIDARGKVIAPGFIDLHAHAGAGLRSKDARRRAAPNLVSQGITTVVINPDGFSSHPVAEQVKLFAKQPIGINAILMAGHNSIRKQVMQDDFKKSASPEQVAVMREQVREDMDAGAYGLSGGLEYSPGIWSTTGELIALVQEVGLYDGSFIVHERASGSDPFWYLPSQDDSEQPSMIDNIRELIEVAQQTQTTVVATHIKARGTKFWGQSKEMIRLIDEARSRGVSIYADQYPYNTSFSDGVLVLIPKWLRKEKPGKLGDGPGSTKGTDYGKQLEDALADEKTANDLRRDIAHVIERRGGAKNIMVMECSNKEFEGKSLAELAEQKNISPVEMAIKLQTLGDRKRPGGARVRSYSMSEVDVEALGAQPWTATATDGFITLPEDGPVHARYYGTFPRKIRHYAIDRGLMSVENAIRSSTSLPAQILGLRDRGMVKEGLHADLIIFDLDRIRDKATFENPHQHSEGIEFVLIGGIAVVEESKVTGNLPASILLRQRGRKSDAKK